MHEYLKYFLANKYKRKQTNIWSVQFGFQWKNQSQNFYGKIHYKQWLTFPMMQNVSYTRSRYESRRYASVFIKEITMAAQNGSDTTH